jgi:hypothetical protein
VAMDEDNAVTAAGFVVGKCHPPRLSGSPAGIRV